MDFSPPRFAERLLARLLRRSDHQAVLGDFEEIYQGICERKGALVARIWYCLQIFKSFPGFVLKAGYWSLVMLKNYLKVTLRNIGRRKGFSMINLFGLAVGIAGCLLISLWVLDEVSFDRFHEFASDLYRVEVNQQTGGVVRRGFSSPVQLAPALEAEIPEVRHATRFTRFGGMQLKYREHSFYEPDIQAADPSFFRMFSFPLISGRVETALSDPFSVVISQRMAEKYFGDDDPLGKVILAENQFELIITGVISNPPNNSSLQYDWIIPFEFVFDNLNRMPEGWVDAISNYVLLEKGIPAAEASKKINELILSRKQPNVRSEYFLYPLTRIRLHARIGHNQLIGTVHYVYIFSLIAWVVLLIACINFMNLSTARSAGRAREIGLRKVVGAGRANIVRQFYGESMLYTLCAMLLAFGLVVLLLPLFNSVAGKSISVQDLFRARVLLALLGVTLFTGLISGSYPALLLSAFQPARVLRGFSAGGDKKSLLRKSLVVFQFSLSVFLFIGTLVVFRQVRFLKTKDLGYHRENMLIIPMRGEIGKSYEPFKKSVLENPGISGITAMSRRPTHIPDYERRVDWDGKNPEDEIRVNFAAVEYDWVETLGLELNEGRSFSREFATDRLEGFLINEELALRMEKESVVGTGFEIFGRKGNIIGVLKNFHFQPLRRKIEPLVLLMAPNPYWLGNIVVRLEPANITASIDYIRNRWEEIFSGIPFEYEFLDEEFNLIYWREARMSKLLGYFSFLAIFIACLGLFGLASFTAEQRTKEIGIRKVLGASVSKITFSLCREFAGLVALANVLAWPAAYFVSAGWLNNFPYRAGLRLGIFLIAGTAAFAIALATVGYQSVKAARANPVEALQYE